MLHVGRLVGRCESLQIQCCARNLSALQNHLYNVLITVITRALLYVEIKYEDVHFLLPYQRLG